MKRTAALFLALFLLLPLFGSQASSTKPPKVELAILKVGESAGPYEGEGSWESQHPQVATISEGGLVSAHSEGYALILLKDKKDVVKLRVEVKVGQLPTPDIIQQAIDLALSDWAEAGGKAFSRYNLYTKWFNPHAKDGFGWCGAYVGYQFDQVGVPMDKAWRTKETDPLPDGSPFVVRQASQTRLYEGFRNRNRLSQIPQPGYFVIYGKRGSTPYTHVALVTAVVELGEGRYLLDTVEGNLSSRIKRYQYIYDSLAQRKERNISQVPKEQQTQPDTYYYEYVSNFFITTFGQTWY